MEAFPMFFSRLRFCFSWFALAAFAIATPAAHAQNTGALRLNQIQVVGSHNSYHAGIAPDEAVLWKATNPKAFDSLDYTHQPLAQQFDAGVRQIELDVFADTKGGLYADPNGPKLVAAAHLPADPPFDPERVMRKPSFKVLHMQDVDYRSTCMTFVACLREVRAWSQAHPRHIPIFILVETKIEPPQSTEQKVTPEPFTRATFDALDAEIRSVFSPAELIAPDDVRGNFATLNSAVLAGNWPTLDHARGKLVFLMDQDWAGPIYLEGHPSLRGRILFTNATPGAPDAAFVERNDGPAAEIASLVRKGYLVRTRTDDSTREARANSTARRDQMMASGAQILSTDYPASEPASWEGHYAVSLPNNAPARCNPVNAPKGCQLGE
jgi:hypothetical protein